MQRLLSLVLLSGLQLVLLSGCQLASADDAKLNEAKALLDAVRARQSYERTAKQFSAFGISSTISSQELQNRIHNEMAKIYSEVYTEKELRNITNFFASPLGQAFLNKKPDPLQFLSRTQLANIDNTNLAEAKALFTVMRARQTIRQVAEQFPIGSGDPNAEVSQGFYDDLYRGMVRAYAQAYTATELRKIREFFATPAGQAYLDKKPLLTKKYLEVVQNIKTEMKMK